jgi:signal peptidase II
MKTIARRWLAAGIVLLVVADWLTKLWVLNRVALGETLALVEGWLYFAHRRNTGVAFSMLSDLPEPWGALGLSLFGLAAAGLLVKLMVSTPDPVARIAIALVTAGALGNVGDRLVNGSVTDFILVAFFPYVFNVADAAITVGGIVLALRMLSGGAQPGPASSGVASADT